MAAAASEILYRAGPGDDDAQRMLSRLTAAVVRHVPGAAHAALTVFGPDGGLVTSAPTDPGIGELGRVQLELGEGPECGRAARGPAGARADGRGGE